MMTIKPGFLLRDSQELLLRKASSYGISTPQIALSSPRFPFYPQVCVYEEWQPAQHNPFRQMKVCLNHGGAVTPAWQSIYL